MMNKSGDFRSIERPCAAWLTVLVVNDDKDTMRQAVNHPDFNPRDMLPHPYPAYNETLRIWARAIDKEFAVGYLIENQSSTLNDFKFWLEMGADDITDYIFGYDLLMFLIDKKRITFALHLIEVRDDSKIMHANRQGYTAMTLASSSDSLHLVKTLINKGYAVNAGNGIHYSPFMRACSRSAVEIAMMLIDAGADTEYVAQGPIVAKTWRDVSLDDTVTRIDFYLTTKRRLEKIIAMQCAIEVECSQ